MVNVTELNRGPDISANEIDAASVSAGEVINNAVYSAKEDLPENAEEGAQAYVSGQGELYLFEVSSPGEWVQAMPEPVRLKNDVNFLLRENVELRHELGLERLDYDNGWADGYFDKELIDSDTDLEGFNGEVSVVDAAAYGELTTTWQDFGFVPESVVIGQSVDGTESNPIVENGEQLEYEIADGEDVEDAFMELTGHDSSSDESRSFSDLSDNDNIQFDVGGNQDISLPVEFSPDGASIDDPTLTEITDPADSVRAADVNSEGDIGVLGDGAGNIWVVEMDDPENPTVSQVSDPSDLIRSVAVSDAGDVALAGSSDENAYLLDISDPSNPSVVTIADPSSFVFDTSLNSGGDVGLAVSGDDSAYIIDSSDVDNPSVIEFSDPTAQVESSALNDNGDIGLVGTGLSEGNLWILDISDLQNPSGTELTAPDDNINDVALNSDGDVGSAASDDGSGYIVDSSDVSNPSVTAVDFAGTDDLESTDLNALGDVSLFGPGFGDGTDIFVVDVSDVSNPTEASSVTDPADVVTSVSLNDDGDIGLAVSYDDSGYSIGLDDINNPSVTEITEPTERPVVTSLNDDGSVGLIGEFGNSGWTVEMAGSLTDPSLTIDGQTASFSGTLENDETHSETLAGISPNTYEEDFSASDGTANVELGPWTETTSSQNIEIEIDSESGTQAVSEESLSDGETVDVSDSIDESLIDGTTTISLSVSSEVDGPVGKTRVNFEHNGVEWSAGAGVFEIEDGDGNTESLLPIDDIQGLNFTDEQVRLNIQYVNGFGDPVTGRNYGVYLNGGD